MPRTASNNSAFSTAPTASICTIPCSSSSAIPDACWPPLATRQCVQLFPSCSDAAAAGAASGGRFPGVKIKMRGDANFALPLLYRLSEFSGLEYALAFPEWVCAASCRTAAETSQPALSPHPTSAAQLLQFSHRAGSWSRRRRICYKAEHTAAGTNLRFLITNCAGRASEVFAFYNDRGESKNRIEKFKNGFHADRRAVTASWPTPSVCPARLLLHPRQPFSSALPQPGAPPRSNFSAPHSSNSALASATPPAVFAFISPAAGPLELVALRRLRRQQQLTPSLSSNSTPNRWSLRSRV